MVWMMLKSCEWRKHERMYSHPLQTPLQNQIGNLSSSQGDIKPKTLKYSFKVFYPSLRSSRECSWVKHRNKS